MKQKWMRYILGPLGLLLLAVILAMAVNTTRILRGFDSLSGSLWLWIPLAMVSALMILALVRAFSVKGLKGKLGTATSTEGKTTKWPSILGLVGILLGILLALAVLSWVVEDAAGDSAWWDSMWDHWGSWIIGATVVAAGVALLKKNQFFGKAVIVAGVAIILGQLTMMGVREEYKSVATRQAEALAKRQKAEAEAAVDRKAKRLRDTPVIRYVAGKRLEVGFAGKRSVSAVHGLVWEVEEGCVYITTRPSEFLARPKQRRYCRGEDNLFPSGKTWAWHGAGENVFVLYYACPPGTAATDPRMGCITQTTETVTATVGSQTAKRLVTRKVYLKPTFLR